MDKDLQELVRRRASGICEYCHFSVSPFHFEHIIARQHGGETNPENIALACARCNFYKGPNLSGIDPENKALVRLFHPRKDVWRDHFLWQNLRLVGITPEGRATIAVLQINHPLRVEARTQLAKEGILTI